MRKDSIEKIYKTAQWRKIRNDQMEKDRYECQRCKHCGKYSNLKGIKRYQKAVLVHHEFRVRKYPQYAFSEYVNGKRNLYSLCQNCHEIEHESERGMIQKKKELNEERW